ncbi:MAG: MarR family transcriptional regulator [Candidatus Woesearchaeota archaeon]|nr:MAG: MarR family transcriptional regulator [Candidatus Woesearchaeota archaeon]
MDAIEQQLLDLIESEPHPFTSQLAKKLKLERHTVAKYLDRLEAKGLVSCKPLGNAKVWQKSVPLVSDLQSQTNMSSLLSSLGSNAALIDLEKNLLWAKHDVGNQKCYHHFGKSSPCENCVAQIALETNQSQQLVLDGKRHLIIPLPENKNAFLEVELS